MNTWHSGASFIISEWSKPSPTTPLVISYPIANAGYLEQSLNLRSHCLKNIYFLYHLVLLKTDERVKFPRGLEHTSCKTDFYSISARS